MKMAVMVNFYEYCLMIASSNAGALHLVVCCAVIFGLVLGRYLALQTLEYNVN